MSRLLQLSCRRGYGQEQLYGQWPPSVNWDIESMPRVHLVFRYDRADYAKVLRIFIVVQIDNYSKCLQTSWRGHRDFSYYKRLRKASVFSQSRWRGIAARREFRKLKMVGIHLLLWSSYWWIIYFKSYRWVYALNFIFWITMWNLPTVPTYIFSVAENLSMLICSCTKHLSCHSVTLTFTSMHSVRATNDQYEVCLSIVIEIFWHVSHFETK